MKSRLLNTNFLFDMKKTRMQNHMNKIMNKEKMYKIISVLLKFNGFLIFTKEKD